MRGRGRELALAALVVVLGLLVVDVVVRDGAPTPREERGPVNPAPSPVIAWPPDDEPAVRSPVSEAELAAARRVAARFLDGYLAFLYGRAPARGVTDVSEPVRRELVRNTPRIPPAQRQRTPRVVDLSVVGQAPGAVIVTASVDDGDVAVYPIVFTLDLVGGRWRVSRLAND
jgi:hypothetical protein